MAVEGAGGLLVPDGPLVCPIGTSVEEAYTPRLCPQAAKGLLHSWRRALSTGKGRQHPHPATQDLKTVN